MTEPNWLINNTDMEEIIYLYTVESKKAKLVEVIDLSDDNKNGNIISKERDLVLSTPRTDQNNNSKTTFDEPEYLYTSPCTDASKGDAIAVAKAREGEVETGNSRLKRKRREIEVVGCNVCREDYEIICKNGSTLLSSKCGHLFCTDCLKNLETYKCIECNEGIWNLCKVYL